MLSFLDNGLLREDIIEQNIIIYVHINIDDITVKKALVDISSNMNIYSANLL